MQMFVGLNIWKISANINLVIELSWTFVAKGEFALSSASDTSKNECKKQSCQQLCGLGDKCLQPMC